MKIGILGIGYVGCPLGNLLSEKFEVEGFDKDYKKVQQLNDKMLKIDGNYSKFPATNDFKKLHDKDVIILCVPTPLKDDKPDLSYINDAAASIKMHAKDNILVILESTVAPGTTKYLASLLPNKFICFSPERIDPGSGIELKTIPKIIGGTTQEATDKCVQLYEQVFDKVIPVKNASTAEVGKLLENIYRFVNISLVNELFQHQDLLNVSMPEVVDALVEGKTPACGYAPFFPGVGISGHCIPVDSLYLEDFLNKNGQTSTLIKASKDINDSMPKFHAKQISKLITQNSKVMVLGLAYKPNVNDFRESRSLDLLTELKKEHNVIYHDPFMATSKSLDLIPEQDIVVFATKHSCYDIEKIKKQAKLIYDCQGRL